MNTCFFCLKYYILFYRHEGNQTNQSKFLLPNSVTQLVNFSKVTCRKSPHREYGGKVRSQFAKLSGKIAISAVTDDWSFLSGPSTGK